MIKAFTTILFLICFISNAFAEEIFYYKNDLKSLSHQYKFTTISINENTEKKENIIETYSKVIESYSNKIPLWMKLTSGIVAVSGAVAVVIFKKDDIRNLKPNIINNIRSNSSNDYNSNYYQNLFSSEKPILSSKNNRKINLEFKF